MIEAELPYNEIERLRILHNLKILDTPIEERFERITRLACKTLGVPISAISLVDKDRQWFKSIQGIDAKETSRSVAFCAHCILDDDVMVVEDATKDKRFHDNPLVAGDPNIRFYAGYPIYMGSDIKIGTLCVIGREKRSLTEDQIETLKDLTAIAQSELSADTLAKAVIAEHQLSRLKNDFISMISHEIRTPLNGIIGTVDIFSETKLDELQRKYINIIKKSGLMLMTIINEVLDFSKIEANKLTLTKERFNLNKAIEEQIALFLPLAEEKGLYIQMDIQSISHCFMGDESRIRQIIGNLLSNAIKFTSRGGIKIRAEIRPYDDASYAEFAVSVSDTGDGISQDNIPLLFSPFVQVSGSAVKRSSGTGLGLTICKRLVEMMQGKIGVESVLGAGSRFYFTAMLGISGDQSEGAVAVNSSNRLFSGRRILIVEDVETNQFVISTMIGSLDCVYDIACNGQEAVDLVKKNTYDLILMDCMMPVMDGYTATEVIRKNGFKDVPIIALTANAMNEDRKRGLQSGMNDYIAKPVIKKDIADSFEKWLK